MSDAPTRSVILDELHYALAGLQGAEPDESVAEVVLAQPLGSELAEAEQWERIGRILRARDVETYKLLRSLGLSLAALLDAPREN
jgi:hypothetical protein